MAFHPYPQLIRRFCSTDRFGPPDGVTRPSPWPWIDRSASRLQRATKTPYSDSVSLRLRLIGLTLPHATTPWLIFQEARSQACHKGIALPLACRSMVSGSLSLPFRGSFHRSLAVLCAIGQPGIFSLTRWSGQIPTTFHGAVVLGSVSQGDLTFSHTGLSPSVAQVFHLILLTPGFVTPRGVGSPLRIRPATPCGLRLPPWHPHGLGYSPFARRYSGNRIRFLFLGLLKGFTSPGSAPPKGGILAYGPVGFPIRESRIIACLRLPGAYRSLPRPSSLLAAEASTMDP